MHQTESCDDGDSRALSAIAGGNPRLLRIRAGFSVDSNNCVRNLLAIRNGVTIFEDAGQGVPFLASIVRLLRLGGMQKLLGRNARPMQGAENLQASLAELSHWHQEIPWSIDKWIRAGIQTLHPNTRTFKFSCNVARYLSPPSNWVLKFSCNVARNLSPPPTIGRSSFLVAWQET